MKGGLLVLLVAALHAENAVAQAEAEGAEDGAPEAELPDTESPETEPSDIDPSDAAEPADPKDPPFEDGAPETERQKASSVTMPQVKREVAPVYPEGETKSGEVILLVTVDAQGRPSAVTVESGLSARLNEAALSSVKAWTFTPARKDGKPVSARVRIAVLLKAPAAPTAEAPNKSEGEEHDPSDVHLQVTVHGERPLRTERRGSSDYFVHREVLEAAPHAEGAEALRVVPGLSMFRTEGLAQAHSYSLRGFDAEHGQDIEFVVGGLPINLPSHIHGQGYSDLGFLVGEVVDQVSVNEGVSDPRQGDFAVSGSLRVGLGVDEERRGLQVRGGYGSFHTPRVQIIWAPKEAERESLGAAQYVSTDGFGENRGGQSASGIVQHRFGTGDVTYRAVGFIHGARAESAGVVRKDDIDSGAVCFHCVYPYPSAEAQNALSQRLMAGMFADFHGPKHANGSVGFYAGRDHYRSQQNFTGFLETSRTLAGEAGRGDLIEQTNGTTTLGLTGRYRTEGFDSAQAGHGTLEVGVDGRFDAIEQSQNLIDGSVRSQVWDKRVDAGIDALSVGIWGDVDWQFTERLQARLGARGTVMSYDVNDRLGNFAPLSRPQDEFHPGYRRSSMGATFGPRASLEFQATSFLWFMGAYGEGYRSPQARTLSDGEKAPFAKVRSGDSGFRLRFGQPVEMSVSAYYAHLSDDVAFDATEGRLESLGPTRRMGVTGYSTLRPTSWLLGSLSVTYVDTAVLEPPPASADEPSPPFEKGQSIPFVSPLVVRLDTSARATLFAPQAGTPLIGRVGVGGSGLAARPLPYNTQGEPIFLLDASLGLIYGPVDFSVAGFNLLNQNYSAQDYMFVSDWDPASPTSRVPARHISAGAPLSVMATLGVTL